MQRKGMSLPVGIYSSSRHHISHISHACDLKTFTANIVVLLFVCRPWWVYIHIMHVCRGVLQRNTKPWGLLVLVHVRSASRRHLRDGARQVSAPPRTAVYRLTEARPHLVYIYVPSCFDAHQREGCLPHIRENG